MLLATSRIYQYHIFRGETSIANYLPCQLTNLTVMKHIRFLYQLIPLTLIVILSSCIDESPTRPCRITKMYWENQWFTASYSSSGRLTLLQADTSKIDFHYNGSNQLVKAEIYGTSPTPQYRFEFVHGPLGIVEANEYHPSIWGEYRTKTVYHYSGPGVVDYMITYEYGADPDPGFIIQEDITYSSGNVKHIHGTSSVIYTDYYGLRYDKRKNPFKALAIAVGNPAFFPVCKIVNFPVSTYDISNLSIFSRNNPLRGEYRVPGVDPTAQSFENYYSGAMAEKIKWSESSYGTVESNDYAFKFGCGYSSTDK